MELQFKTAAEYQSRCFHAFPYRFFCAECDRGSHEGQGYSCVAY